MVLRAVGAGGEHDGVEGVGDLADVEGAVAVLVDRHAAHPDVGVREHVLAAHRREIERVARRAGREEEEPRRATRPRVVGQTVRGGGRAGGDHVQLLAFPPLRDVRALVGVVPRHPQLLRGVHVRERERRLAGTVHGPLEAAHGHRRRRERRARRNHRQSKEK